MAIAHRASSVTTATATSITGNAPAGLAENDLLLAIVHGTTAGKTPAVADGVSWTQIISDGTNGSTFSVWRRVAGSSEPSTYAFKHSDDSSDTFSLTIAAWSGVDPVFPQDTQRASNVVTNATIILSAISTTVDDAVVVAINAIGSAASVLTPPAGYSLVADNDGFDPGSSIYAITQASKGTTGNVTYVATASAVQKGVMFALRPAAVFPVLRADEFPSTGTNIDNAGGNAWATPSNVTTSNNSETTAVANGTTPSDFLRASNFGFSIPSEATIVGVVAIIEHRRSGGTTGQIVDNSVRLVDASGAETGDNKASAFTWQTTADAYDSYGDLDDLWGATLTPAVVNDTDFGVRLAIQGQAAGADRNANVDSIRLFVYYTMPVYAAAAAAEIEFTGGVTAEYSAPEPEAETGIVSGGSGGRTRGDRTRYGWGVPRFRRDEDEEREAEPAESSHQSDDLSTRTDPPAAEVRSVRVEDATPPAPDPAEAELELQVALLLLGVLDE